MPFSRGPFLQSMSLVQAWLPKRCVDFIQLLAVTGQIDLPVTARIPRMDRSKRQLLASSRLRGSLCSQGLLHSSSASPKNVPYPPLSRTCTLNVHRHSRLVGTHGADSRHVADIRKLRKRLLDERRVRPDKSHTSIHLCALPVSIRRMQYASLGLPLQSLSQPAI